MKKCFAAVMASLVSMTAFAFGEVRIDLRSAGKDCVNAGDFASAEKMVFKKMKEGHSIIISGKMSDQWQKIEFSFVPDADGKISLFLQAPGSSRRDLIKPLLIDDVKVAGAVMQNGGFEQLNKSGIPVGWRFGRTAKVVPGAGIDGSNAVQVSYSSGMCHSVLALKAGEKVTVSFQAKLAQ